MYKTKQKNALIEFLKENSCNAYTSKQLCRIFENSISKATIYRLIDYYFENKVINRFFNSTLNTFEYKYIEDINECNTMLHSKCNKCGKIFHLKNTLIESNFKIDFNNSIIYGICSECL